jgi:hypothetical protein
LFSPGGSFILTKNHEGRWVGMDGSDVPSRYEIRVGVLFDKVWPKFYEAIMSHSQEWRMPEQERRAHLDAYREWISTMRRDGRK